MSEAEQSPPPAEEEERPFQFSLRTMFVVTFVWAVICAIGATFGLAAAVSLAAVCSLIGGFAMVFVWRKKAGGMLIALACVLLVMSIATLPPIDSAREAARRSSCVNRVKQLGVAMHNYVGVYGCLPPAYVADESGRPMHSWRVLILPYLDRNDIYCRYNFDEPWDGPNNRKLHDLTVKEFRCPAEKSTAKDTDTCYVAVVGPNTIFTGAEPVKFESISDGMSNTIMLVEVSDSGIHWMEPRDLNIESMPLVINPPSGKGISSNHPGIARVLFADGSVDPSANGQITPEGLRALLSRNGREDVRKIINGY